MNTGLLKLAAVIAALSAATPVLAEGDMSPIGVWAPENQESRYEFSYCGDGTALCARLVWIRPDKQKPSNMSEMGKLMLDTAKPKGKASWAGKIRIKGQEADGTVKQVAPDKLHIKACQYLVVCAEIDLVPPVSQ